MILLIDGSNIARACFETHKTLKASTGEMTGGIFGTLISLYKLKRDIRPDKLFFFWDLSISKWRVKLYPEYKAHRAEVDKEVQREREEYRRQMGEIRKALELLGVPQLAVYGVEADDLIGIASTRLLQETNETVRIVSSDKDFYQLLRPGLQVGRNSGIYHGVMTLAKFAKQFGVDPVMWPDVRALMGDKSDNIPGVRGIGEKHALDLVSRFGSIGEILKMPDRGDRYVAMVQADHEKVRLYRMLAVIPRHASDKCFDSETIAKIEHEMRKLHSQPSRIRKQEFKEFVFDKEFMSIHRTVNSWFHAFGGAHA